MSYTISSGEISSAIILKSNSMSVKSGGVANDTIANSGGLMYISSGGVANGTIVNSGGIMRVYSGGVANDTTVNSAGYLCISSGGTATQIVENGGYVNVEEGAEVDFASNTISCVGLGFNGSMTVHKNTTANYTSVYRYGHMTIFSGGVANDTTVKGGGYMRISSGGVANRTKLSADHQNYASMYISSGGVANDTTVSEYSDMYIYNGGVANSTTVNSGGEMYISSGGEANDTIVISSSIMRVYSGGVANDTTANSGGWMYINSGGEANDTTVNSSGSMRIEGGGVANGTTVNSRGEINILYGGVANDTTVNAGGYLYISSGGKANDTVVSSSGIMRVSSRGIANDTTVNAGGNLYISSGGTATIAFNPWQGTIYASAGAVVSYLERDANIYYGNTTSGLIAKYDSVNVFNIASGNSAITYAGGVANNTTVNSGGGMYISSGGVANNTTVSSGGYMYITDGGTATQIVENGGYVKVTDGAEVEFASNTISGLVLSYYTSMTVHQNTVANSTTVNSGGKMHISSGGTASVTNVNDGGYMRIFSGGVVNSTTVNSYGGMDIYSGGTHCGSLLLEDGAIVSAYTGAIIDFTLTDRTAEDDYLINNFAFISGTPTYTITVSDDQTFGTYKLAQDAENFTGSISIGDGSFYYGTVTVNGTALEYNEIQYTLTQTEGNLLLSVVKLDLVAPELHSVEVESTAEGLLYTLSGSDDQQLAGFEYRLDDGEWQLSESGEILISSNAVVDFRAVDAAGNHSDIITRQANAGTASGNVFGTPDANGDMTLDFAQTSVVNGTVYGSKNKNIFGDVKFSATGGDFNGYVHAGIVADDGDMYQVKGSLTLEFTDTTFDNGSSSRIYAAGDISNGSFVRVNGDVNLTLDNVTTSIMTYVGANVGKNSDFVVKGSLNAEINGGTYKTIYVGSSVANGGVSTISGNVALTINGGTFGQVGMGSQSKTGASSIVSGNSLLTINGGYFTAQVYGGAYSQGGTATIVGDAGLTINGGTFTKNIYAGSFASAAASGKDTNSLKTTIGGDTVLTLNAVDNKISFAAGTFLYAGSSNFGVVAGSSNVIIRGNGENLIFGGDNVISGDSLMYQQYQITYIGGDKNITFDNFSGLLDAQLFAFTRISVINGSCVELSNQEHLSDIAEWNIGLVDGETAIACESGKNNFAGDTLALTFDTALDDAVIFDGGTGDLIDNWNKLSAISFNGVAGSWSDIEMAWVDAENKWKVFADNNNDLVINKLA